MSSMNSLDFDEYERNPFNALGVYVPQGREMLHSFNELRKLTIDKILLV